MMAPKHVQSSGYMPTHDFSAQFTCRNGQGISSLDVCDGQDNCGDGSDENHRTCLQFPCLSGTFTCAYGGCIDGGKNCDGIRDCADRSDELISDCDGVPPIHKHSYCNSGSFQCHNGQCIDLTKICDGQPDCEDKSDETIATCYNLRCSPGTFRCAYGACIENSKKCDRKKDCADGSDENDFLCDGNFISVNKGYKPVIKIPVTPNPVISAPVTQNPVTSVPVMQMLTPKPNPITTISSNSCVVPKLDGTRYTDGPNNNSREVLPYTEVTQDNPYLFVFCEDGFYRPYNFILCENGKWNHKNNLCIRLCNPLNITFMKLKTCLIGNTPLNCSERVPPGTTATLECKEGYQPVSGGLYLENKCQETGTWQYSYTPQHCTYGCGQKQGVPLIALGVEAYNYNHPWNAALYQKFTRKKQSAIIHVCGGTLIAPFIVLTAAHCVTEDSTNNNTGIAELKNAKHFIIGLGKNFREFNSSADASTAQYINVENIHVDHAYNGVTGRYYSDLAILELKEQANIAEVVSTACVAIETKITFSSEAVFTVVGWGLDESLNQTETLREVDMPYSNLKNCSRFAIEKLEERIQKDKFCGFFEDNYCKGPNRGDSGSGAIYKYEGRYYVIGVVSTLLGTNRNVTIRTFTNITDEHNIILIKTKIKEINEKRNQLLIYH